eukprot:CAMPEP_0204913630 /NCGR_PEP_ID=MMETSP1397-20131031/11458_1 /ASSEMBLY_ACC=CAM_ASM_000891 /TAXON_ID=49980 /ORGANISM="Climacostomum Climacostomum virens, Strain Stock W-24" /LENGTH=66 /DNA_ID=CAMNT_0052084895 /DNA_START=452 /DNA_END=652 /DNA_ORIENTATION=+
MYQAITTTLLSPRRIVKLTLEYMKKYSKKISQLALRTNRTIKMIMAVIRTCASRSPPKKLSQSSGA